MISKLRTLNTPPKIAWYCLQCLPKRERISAENIRSRIGIEVFCPRITYLKRTRRGKVRFTEALFPGYLFVRCDITVSLRHLLSMRGVKALLRYGTYIPTVPDNIISVLRTKLGGEHLEIERPAISAGSEVVILEGPFKNLTAIVSGQVPARERVQLLLEFLGQEITVDMPTQSLLAKKQEPKAFMGIKD